MKAITPRFKLSPSGYNVLVRYADSGGVQCSNGEFLTTWMVLDKANRNIIKSLGITPPTVASFKPKQK